MHLGVGISRLGTGEVPARSGMRYPRASMSCNRPYHERIEVPAVCRQTFYRRDESPLLACASVAFEVIARHQYLQRTKDAEQNPSLTHVIML